MMSTKDVKQDIVVNEKALIAILFAIQFTHIMDFVIMMPLGPKFMRFFSIGPSEFSIVVSAYTFAAAIAGIVGSFFMDLFDRKSALVILYIGFIIGTLACAIAPTYETLVLARITAGGFGGILGALIFSVIGDVIPEERRGKATGTVMAAFSVASVIGIPTGLFLAETFHWHAPFIFLTVVGFFVLFFIVKEMPNLKGHMKEASTEVLSKKQTVQRMLKEFKIIFSDSNHQRAFMLSIAIMLSGFMVIPFVPPYMVNNVGLTEKELPYIYFFGGLCTFVTSRLIGAFSDKYGKFKMFSIVAPLSMIPILIVTNLPPVSLVIALMCSTMFFVLVSGRFVPVMAIITSSTVKEKRGAFMSLNSTIQMMATGSASLIAGKLIQQSSDGKLVGFQTTGIIACVLTIISIFLAKRVKVVQ